MSKPGTPGAYHFAPTMFNLRERLASQWATAKKHLMLVLLFVGILWAVLIIDTALPDHWIDLRNAGIRPRTVSGLLCIFTAPFLHVNVFHLLANTLPLVILGWILVLSGRGLFLQVCAVTALTSGLGAWSLGHGDMIHEGASGVLFGLLGFLLTRGWFARRIVWTVTSACVGLFYLGEVLGLLRDSPGISWSSHFWGFVGGIGMAWWMYGRPGVQPAAPVAKAEKTTAAVKLPRARLSGKAPR
jgi:membrane associated rhomboid family serine protease